jgi:YesN/AraC family two-component response regulator
VAIIVASTKYELLQIDVSKQVISTLNTIIVIAAVAFIFVFFYFYLEIIKPMDDKKNFASAPEEKIQEAESVQLKELYNNIVNYFEKKQPYCHPNYRLTLLATDLNTNTKYVSNAINKYYGGTFDNFLNKYRIEYVKKMLDEHLDEKYTMEYIYTLAGYSNRTTFYVNFQKIMKMSPRDYHELKNSKVLVSK